MHAVRYVLWDATGWHRIILPRVAQPGHGGAEEEGLGDGGADREDNRQVLHEAHERQVEETMEVLSKGPDRSYG